ncbi:hypothetical protein BC828DRAFT_382493 [Blastocladiella britannica]|nr:hypothetical protein BC828DRAFT_382493 [Blastocladiella britannica]
MVASLPPGTNPSVVMYAISMFLAPVCTTSSSARTASLMAPRWSRSAVYCFSRNSRTVLALRPMALAFHAA